MTLAFPESPEQIIFSSQVCGDKMHVRACWPSSLLPARGGDGTRLLGLGGSSAQVSVDPVLERTKCMFFITVQF